MISFEQPQPLVPSISQSYGQVEQFDRGTPGLISAAGLAQRANLASYANAGRPIFQGDQSSLLGQQGQQQRQLAQLAQQGRMEQQQAQAKIQQDQLAQQYSHADELRIQRLNSARSSIENDPTLSDQDKHELLLQVNTGLDLPKRRQQAALAQQEEQKANQLKQKSQTDAIADKTYQDFMIGNPDGYKRITHSDGNVGYFTMDRRTGMLHEMKFSGVTSQQKQQAEDNKRWDVESKADDTADEKYIADLAKARKDFVDQNTNKETKQAPSKEDADAYQRNWIKEHRRGRNAPEDRLLRQLRRHGLHGLADQVFEQGEIDEQKSPETAKRLRAFRDAIGNRNRGLLKQLQQDHPSYLQMLGRDKTEAPITEATGPPTVE